MIKETFTLFLSQQQQDTLRNDDQNNRSNEQRSESERQTHAAEAVQVNHRINT